MKGKFLKGMGKGMAMLLAAAMLFTSNGVTTLAAGLEAGNAASETETAEMETAGTETEEAADGNASEDEILLDTGTGADAEGTDFSAPEEEAAEELPGPDAEGDTSGETVSPAAEEELSGEEQELDAEGEALEEEADGKAADFFTDQSENLLIETIVNNAGDAAAQEKEEDEDALQESGEEAAADEEDAVSGDGVTVKDLLEDALQKELDEDIAAEDEAEAVAVEEEIILTEAQTFEDGGIKYTVDGTTLTIEVTGDPSGGAGKFPWKTWVDDTYTWNKSDFTTVVVSGAGLTDTSYMFCNFTHATTIDVSRLDTSQVVNMAAMFSGCISVKTLDVSSFDTSKVTGDEVLSGLNSMFAGCTALESIKFSDKFTAENCVNVKAMFDGCKALTSLDLSKFNLAKITSSGQASSMLNNCNALTSIETPLNLGAEIKLPTSNTYYYNGKAVDALPQKETVSYHYSTNSSGATVMLTVSRGLTGGKIEILDANGTQLTSDSSNEASVAIGSTIKIQVVPDSGYTFSAFYCTDKTHYQYDSNDSDYAYESKDGYAVITLNKSITVADTFVAVFNKGNENQEDNATKINVIVAGNDNCTIKVDDGADNTNQQVTANTKFTVKIMPAGGFEIVTATGSFTTAKVNKSVVLYSKTSAKDDSTLNSDGSVTVTFSTGMPYDITITVTTGEKTADVKTTCTMSVTQPDNGTIELSTDGKTYTKTNSVSVEKDAMVYVKITPAEDFSISEVYLDDTDKRTVTDTSLYEESFTMDADHSISATLAKPDAETYSMTGLTASTAYTVSAEDYTIASDGTISGLVDLTSVKVKVTPEKGFYVKQVKVNENPVSGTADEEYGFTFSYTINGADASVSIEYGYLYTLTLEQPANGEATATYGNTTVTDKITVKSGETVQVEVKAKKGYRVAKVSYSTAEKEYTDQKEVSIPIEMTKNLTLSAEMAEYYYTITVTQPENGTISVNDVPLPSDGTYSVQEGKNVKISVLADEGNDITSISDVTADKTESVKVTDSSRTEFTLSDVSEDHSVSAVLETRTFTVTVTKPSGCTISANGIPLPSDGKVTVEYGKSVELSITAETGKKITGMTVDGKAVDKLKNRVLKTLVYTVANVKADTAAAPTVDDMGADATYEGEDTYKIMVKQPDSGSIVTTDGKTIKDGIIEVSVVTSSIAFKITAGKRKIISGILVNGDSVEAATMSADRKEATYTLSNILADQTFTAVMEDEPAVPRTVTIEKTGEGEVTLEGAALEDNQAVVDDGTKITVKVSPADGYKVSSFLIDGNDQGKVTEAKTTVSTDITVKVTFTKLAVYEIAVSTEGKGSVAADGLQDGKASVVEGTDLVLSITPETGYYVDKIVDNGVDTQESGTTYTLTDVQGKHEIQVTFAEKKADAKYYTVGLKDTANGTIETNQDTVSGTKSMTAGGSQVTVSRSCEVMEGRTVRLTFVPADGYMLGTVLVNGEAVAVNNNTCLLTVEKDMVVEASFKKDVLNVKITVSANMASGGTVTASPVPVVGGEISVGMDEASEIIKITANDGYEIKSVIIDGEAQELSSAAEFTYEFKDFTKSHQVTVEYAESGLTLKLDGIGDVRFEKDKDGNLTTSANLIPADSSKPFIGAIFGGWYTGKDGTGTLVIDRTGALTADALQALVSGAALYARWQKITLVERQKISVEEYFQSELEAFQAANPKAKNKYRYVVYTQDSLNEKFAADTKNKIGSVTKKGLFTAKYAGIGRIYLETYDAAAKTYVKSGTCIDIAVEKLTTAKLSLCYAGETAELGQYLTYSYADVLGYTPQSGDVGDLEIKFSSSKTSVVSVDEKTGKLTAVGFGTAKIKVTYSLTYQDGKKPGTVSKTISVTVKAPKLASAKLSVRVGQSKANKLKNLRTGDTVTWTVADSSVATIDAQSGQVTAVSAGETLVTAHITYASGKTDDTCQYAVIVK